jgi:hypothetical protein
LYSNKEEQAMFVEVVKAFANANYEVNGWDIVVECYADDEIEMVTRNATSDIEAVSMMQEWVKPQADFREELQAEF